MNLNEIDLIETWDLNITRTSSSFLIDFDVRWHLYISLYLSTTQRSDSITAMQSIKRFKLLSSHFHRSGRVVFQDHLHSSFVLEIWRSCLDPAFSDLPLRILIILRIETYHHDLIEDRIEFKYMTAPRFTRNEIDNLMD